MKRLLHAAKSDVWTDFISRQVMKLISNDKWTESIAIMTDYPTPQTIHYELAHPEHIPQERLVALTRDYYNMSAASVDQSLSPSHRWYYRLACECERRGLNLGRVIGKAKHG